MQNLKEKKLLYIRLNLYIICESVRNLHKVWKCIHVFKSDFVKDGSTTCINWNIHIPNPNLIRKKGGGWVDENNIEFVLGKSFLSWC